MALAVVLLNKEFAYEQMGDLEAALATLAEAAPYVKISGDARLLSVLRFETAKDLCAMERFEEAATLMPGVRELAEQLGNKLDIVRVGWLAARIDAGQGRREDAIAGLEQVRREFTDRPIPYDAARSSLELSVLYLEEGRTGAVKSPGPGNGGDLQVAGNRPRGSCVSFGLLRSRPKGNRYRGAGTAGHRGG